MINNKKIWVTIVLIVLIALMILAVFIYFFSQVTKSANVQDKQQKIEQINEFNKPYESYQRNLLRGYDIVTVSNKANDYNIRYRESNIAKTDKDEEIHIYVTFKLGDFDKFKNNEVSDLTEYFKDVKNNYKQKIADFREKYFKCTDVKYNGVTGKVNALYFEELDGNKLFNKV